MKSRERDGRTTAQSRTAGPMMHRVAGNRAAGLMMPADVQQTAQPT